MFDLISTLSKIVFFSWISLYFAKSSDRNSKCSFNWPLSLSLVIRLSNLGVDRNDLGLIIDSVNVERLKNLHSLSHYYSEARELSKLISLDSKKKNSPQPVFKDK